MKPDPKGDEPSRVTDAMHDDAGNHAQAFAVPLLVDQGGTHEVAGSGVLLRIWTEHFLLTAGHVAEGIRAALRGVRVYGRNPSTGQIWPLKRGEFRIVNEDSCDVGALGLPDDLALMLGDPANYLDLDQLDSNEMPGEGSSYLVCGFPTGLYDDESRKVKCVRYLARSRGDECKRSHNPALDIILNYRPGTTDGKPIEVSPKGMSGGGIWRFFAPGYCGTWKRSDLRLVGIQHRWDSVAQYLRGTRIVRALQLIVEMRPDLIKLIRERHPSV